MSSRVPMRDGYGKALMELCEKRKDVMVLDADVAKSTRTVWIRDKYPDYLRCEGEGDVHYTIVDRAIEMGCQKVQLFKPYFDQAMIDKAHAHGIKCNVFWSDDPEEAVRFLDMGIDTILSNDYNRVAQAVRAWKRKKGLI